MTSKTIHFAHGNGFPSKCYQALFSHLQSANIHCLYINKVGHQDKYPVTDNWSYLVDEVIDSIESQTSEPVIGVGHSLGGVLNFMAAHKKPELFKQIIMLDSPVLSKTKSKLLKLAKWVKLIDKLTPAQKTKHRKKTWKSREEVLTYLSQKPLFANFSKACVEDYISFGLNQNENGFELDFSPIVEYQIYRTMPHTLFHIKPMQNLPIHLIYGTKSRVVDIQDIKFMHHYYGILLHSINGGHMFPFERPKDCANLLIDLIKP